MTMPVVILLWAAAGSVAVWTPTLPTPDKTGLTPSLRRLLLEDFKAETFDGQWLRELGPAAVSEADDAVSGIARRMQQAERLIGHSQTGRPTQKLQQGIVADLEALVEQARGRCQQCTSSGQSPQDQTTPPPADQPPKKKPGGGQKPGTPGQDDAKPPPDMDAMIDMLQALEIWGELPERARQQMLQLPREEFLPKYELLIEEYFRRLSEEPNGGPDR